MLFQCNILYIASRLASWQLIVTLSTYQGNCFTAGIVSLLKKTATMKLIEWRKHNCLETCCNMVWDIIEWRLLGKDQQED